MWSSGLVGWLVGRGVRVTAGCPTSRHVTSQQYLGHLTQVVTPQTSDKPSAPSNQTRLTLCCLTARQAPTHITPDQHARLTQHEGGEAREHRQQPRAEVRRTCTCAVGQKAPPGGCQTSTNIPTKRNWHRGIITPRHASLCLQAEAATGKELCCMQPHVLRCKTHTNILLLQCHASVHKAQRGEAAGQATTPAGTCVRATQQQGVGCHCSHHQRRNLRKRPTLLHPRSHNTYWQPAPGTHPFRAERSWAAAAAATVASVTAQPCFLGVKKSKSMRGVQLPTATFSAPCGDQRSSVQQTAQHSSVS
jgi:hypothetical protein